MTRGEDWAARWRQTFATGSVERLVVADVTVVPGELAARLRDRQDRAIVRVPAYDDDRWQAIVAWLASEVRHHASLLAGEVPDGFETAVVAAGVSLVPDRDDVAASCGQPDHGDDCEHVAAVHERFARVVEVDPFALTALRGRTREELLAALRTHRGGGRAGQSVPEAHDPGQARSWYEADDDLAAIPVHPAPPHEPTGLLLRLEDPPGLRSGAAPLERLVEAAAATAWRLAAGEGSDVADEELLLTELRARPAATAATIAEALGWPTERARELMDRLYEEGTLLRTGQGEGARYRA